MATTVRPIAVYGATGCTGQLVVAEADDAAAFLEAMAGHGVTYTVDG